MRGPREIRPHGRRYVAAGSAAAAALLIVGLLPASGGAVPAETVAAETVAVVATGATPRHVTSGRTGVDDSAPVVRLVRFDGAATPARVDTSDAPAAVTVRMAVTDDRSGVDTVTVRVTSPNGAVSLRDATRVTSADRGDWYAARLVLPTRSPRGVHRVSITVTDHAGNTRTLRSAGMRFMRGTTAIGPSVIRQVGVGDSHAPEVTSVRISDREFSTESASVSVTITASVTDADAGVVAVDITLSGPDCLVCFADQTEITRIAGDTFSGQYQRAVTFPTRSPKGTYRISVTVRDAVGNERTLASRTLGDLRAKGVSVGPSLIQQNGDGPTIDGYVVRLDGNRIVGPGTSVAPGEDIGFALSTVSDPAITADLRITDSSGRVMTTLPDVRIPQKSEATPAPWLTGQGFDVVTRLTIPASWPSGVYFVRDDPALFFIVRPRADDLPAAADAHTIGVLLPTNTFNAYSTTAGRSLYSRNPPVPKVSFLRYQNEVREYMWLDLVNLFARGSLAGSQRVIMLADSDVARSDYLDRLSTLVIIGHSEYWTTDARANLDSFIDGGGHVLSISGNTLWWQSQVTGPGGTQLYVPKVIVGASDPLAGTNRAADRWRELDPRLSAVRTLGADFNRGGYGLSRYDEADGWGGYLICEPTHPLFAGTQLAFGDVLPLARQTEYDGPPILGFDARGCPVPDAAALDAQFYEILGFDLGYRRRLMAPSYTLGAITLMRRTATSGVVVNMGTFDVGTTLGRADDPRYTRAAARFRRIIRNALDLLSRDALPVAPLPSTATVTTPFVTPSTTPVPPDFIWLVNRPANDQNPRFTGTR